MRQLKVSLLSILLTPWVVLAQDNIFSFEECIDYALSNNQLVVSAEIEKQISETTIGETLGRGLPQVSAAADFVYNPQVQSQILPDFLSPTIYGVLVENSLVAPSDVPQNFAVLPAQFGTEFTSSATLNVNQLVFDASYFIGLKAARTLRELTRKQSEGTKIDVVENVTKTFYLTLINKERIELAKANLGRLDTLLNETRILQENGFAEKIDVQRIQVSYNNVKAQYENLKNLQQVSYYALKTQMGMPVGQEIDIEGTMEDFTFSASRMLEMDYAYENRNEYSQLNTNMMLSSLDKKNNASTYYPKLYAFGRFGYNSGFLEFDQFTNGDNWFGFASIGLNITWTIFDGLQAQQRMQRNQLQLEQLENQRELVENQIDTEVLRAKAELKNALENLEIQTENKALAEEVYRTTTIKYEEGVGSNIEVINANTSFLEAQTNYYNALYDALVAKVELEKAIGILYN